MMPNYIGRRGRHKRPLTRAANLFELFISVQPIDPGRFHCFLCLYESG
jgi:hypothetical protein